MKTILIIAFLVTAYFGSAYAMREQFVKTSSDVCERQIKGVDCDCVAEAIRQEFPLSTFWIQMAVVYGGGKQRTGISASQCVV